MTADQVRQAALEIAEAAINLSVVDPDLWQSVPYSCAGGSERITPAEEEAIRVELRVVAEGVRTKLHRLLPPPVQPVWSPR